MLTKVQKYLLQEQQSTFQRGTNYIRINVDEINIIYTQNEPLMLLEKKNPYILKRGKKTNIFLPKTNP